MVFSNLGHAPLRRHTAARSLRRRSTCAALALWLSYLLAGPSSLEAGISASPLPLPWEIWSDLHHLPVLADASQVLLRSSHCLSGGRFDRHSAGDERYLRKENGEGVIFEEPGAGAITRIWMTTGDMGRSKGLDPSVIIRIYLDGNPIPVIDVPLPDLFDGSTPPFLPPLVGDRPVSSGGNYSYVPIPFRRGCRVTLVGADLKKLWYQFSFHRLAEAGDIKTFTGAEDLGDWASLLSADGDPWPIAFSGNTPPPPLLTGQVSLAPGELVTLTSLTGADSITALRFGLLPQAWAEIELILSFDGQPRMRMLLSDFFSTGRPGLVPSRSLLIGVDADDFLYSYFPMPFFENLEVSLRRLDQTDSSPIEASYSIRLAGQRPHSDSGLFGAQLRHSEATDLGDDFPLLDLHGQGKWVGLFVELGSVGSAIRGYLEGDERVFIDDSPYPSVYGTGVEDFYNGGFYFDQGSFLLPLHGSPYQVGTETGEDVTAAYRLMLTDSISFASSLFAGVQVGPFGNTSMRARTVAFYYLRSQPRLVRTDVLDLGDPESRSEHGYEVIGQHDLQTLNGFFEGEPLVGLEASGVYRPLGRAQFVLRAHPLARSWRLRRRLDAGLGGQRADVYVNGVFVAQFPAVPENPSRRWREIDIDLPSQVGDLTQDGYLFFSVLSRSESILTAATFPSTPDIPPNSTFSEFQYELWSEAYPFACPGDVNEDSRRDVLDMVTLVDQLTGKLELLGVQLAAADVNQDGRVGVDDLVQLQRHISGEERLPECSGQE